MASVLISLSLSNADADIRELIESIAADPNNLVGGDVKACFRDYIDLCKIIKQSGMGVFIDYADKVKYDKSPRGHTLVLLANDIKGDEE